MFTPHTYPVALLMMLVSMLCWGSWANTQKIDKMWRFELFYWDYMWGILGSALLFGLTLGRANPAAPVSFFHNLDSASTRSLVEAFSGGMIFNLGNLLLIAAISVAGMAVAFPLGAGLALVIGAALNYVVSPAGNPLLLFGGILLVSAAIAANAMAYRGLSKGAKAGTKGIVLSLLCGVVIGLFYPFVARALVGENHLNSRKTMVDPGECGESFPVRSYEDDREGRMRWPGTPMQRRWLRGRSLACFFHREWKDHLGSRHHARVQDCHHTARRVAGPPQTRG